MRHNREGPYCLLKTIVESCGPRGLSLWRATVRTLPSPDSDNFSIVVNLNSWPSRLPARTDDNSRVLPSLDQVVLVVLVPPWTSAVASLPSRLKARGPMGPPPPPRPPPPGGG